jgi:hypothetical protein
MTVVNLIRVKSEPNGVRALIETRLGVETTLDCSGDTWYIKFTTEDIDPLDFLRPWTLPPHPKN